MTQKEALDILKLGDNVFLTGSAGSGKTFLLNQYIDYLKSNGANIGITASTGIAATHMNGITIHSWSGIGIKDKLTDEDIRRLFKNGRLKKRFDKTKVLVIDEISMLHHFQLDLVDKVCKIFKQDGRPFGGMQVVLCGDFFQLPPVAKNNEDARFANESEAWRDMNPKVCYLDEQHRHNDSDLTKILNDIRADNAGEQTLEVLRTRHKAEIANWTEPVKLYTHNIDVDFINGRELQKLPGKFEIYKMNFRGPEKLAEVLKRGCLAPEELTLKKDALVMFVKNNFEEGYVNGTLGRVVDFSGEGLPVVETAMGREIMVYPEKWMIEEDGEIRAEISQIPLRLAWAITVHKSQGMTLDAAEIDLSGAFVEGMGYVALSRVRDLAGLRLMGINDMAIRVNKSVLSLDRRLMEESKIASAELNHLTLQEKENKQRNFLRSVASVSAEKSKSPSTYEETKLLVEQKFPIATVARLRGLKEETIFNHLEKLLAKGVRLNLEYLLEGFPVSRLGRIKEAFRQSGDLKLSPVREILGENYSYGELRLARLFLDEK